jgi:hypothetical protein
MAEAVEMTIDVFLDSDTGVTHFVETTPGAGSSTLCGLAMPAGEPADEVTCDACRTIAKWRRAENLSRT